MKVIFVIRMFSGLIDSIEKKEWKPYGVPAIYKLIEHLDKKAAKLDILLLCKTEKESKTIKGIKKIQFNNLNANFYVFQYHRFGISSYKLRQFYNDCIQFSKVLYKFFMKDKYDLAYFDRANILLAAICSHLGTKTVVRFLGAANFTRFVDKVTSILYSPLVFLSLKVPYSLVICSEDGSASKGLFERYLYKKTPYRILLNGVDREQASEGNTISIRSRYNFNDGVPIFLFVGRMTDDKGVREFVDVMINLKNESRKFYAILVCGGEDFTELAERICQHGMQHQVVFERFVEHKTILSYYEQADVYISLNKFGNLSNTVLEAMAAGKCIIMLNKDEKTHTDESTKRLVPNDVVIRIDRNNIVNDLTDKMIYLVENPIKINSYSERMKLFAKDFLWSWDERINYELRLLESIAEGEAIER